MYSVRELEQLQKDRDLIAQRLEDYKNQSEQEKERVQTYFEVKYADEKPKRFVNCVHRFCTTSLLLTTTLCYIHSIALKRRLKRFRC